MSRAYLSRAARLAVACVAFFSITSTTEAGLPADHASSRNLDVWQGLPPLDLAVCANPFAFPESDKTNVLKALLGEDVQAMQVAGR